MPSNAADAPLAVGTASGTFTHEKETATLTHAAAFVDEKEEARSTILILSDRKLPAEQWTSEFDLIRFASKTDFNGVAFFINKAGEPFRFGVYWKGRQSAVSGFFSLKLDDKTAKKVSGSARTTDDAGDKYMLAVRFHAVLK